HYLGPWPAAMRTPPPEAREAYDHLIAEWLANGRRLPSPEPDAALTVNELILAFWKHAEHHYRRPDGSATNALGEYRFSLPHPTSALRTFPSPPGSSRRSS